MAMASTSPAADRGMNRTLVGGLAIGAATAGVLFFWLRDPAVSARVEHAAQRSETASEPSPAELQRDESATARAAVREAPAPGVPTPDAHEPPALETPQTPPPSSEDVALLRDTSDVPPVPLTAEDVRKQYSDLEARYAKMSAADLKSTFDSLVKLLEENSASGNKANALTPSQIDAIRREITWLKEKVYP
jgi:hypothetical protein